MSLSSLDKKKEKVLFEKYSEDLVKSIDEKYNMIGKTGKKDYITLAVDMCHSALLKKGYFLKLPYEQWAAGLFNNLFSEKNLNLGELKGLIQGVNEILNLDDNEVDNKQDEIAEYFKKMFNTY